MKINKILVYIILFIQLSTVLAVVSLYIMFGDEKVVYVRSAELVEKYEGMKEVRAKYAKKLEEWKSDMIAKQQSYDSLLNTYNTVTDKKQKQQIEKELIQRRDMLLEYEKKIKNEAYEEDMKITQGALDQINSFIENYAEKNGYDLVLGVTTNGNILYGNEPKDITEELIVEINKDYKGK